MICFSLTKWTHPHCLPPFFLSCTSFWSVFCYLFYWLSLIFSFSLWNILSSPLPATAHDVHVHFPPVTKGNMDGEGQVDLSRTKGWRSKSKKREANQQGKIVGYADTQHIYHSRAGHWHAQRTTRKALFHLAKSLTSTLFKCFPTKWYRTLFSILLLRRK